MMDLPPDPPDAILLGWKAAESFTSSIGFSQTKERLATGTPIYAERESHLCTIGSTGAGKGRGQIIPALLSYKGSIFCVDPKGENVAVTARYRRNMGQAVYVLDPFHITDEPSATLDPLDCLSLPKAQLESDAEMLADMLFPAEKEPRHAFWDNLAKNLVAGMLVHAATKTDVEHVGLAGAYKLLSTSDDFEYKLATMLDNKIVTHPYAYRAFAQYLALGNGNSNNNVRPDTLATARSHLAILASESVQKSVTDSSFSLTDVIAGKPMTIYLVLPLVYMESHSRLLRIWLACLMRAILMRRTPPNVPTLFLLDESAALGNMPQLRQAVTTLRGYGVRVWSFWQNVAQLRQCYPQDWETMVDNCRHLAIFGVNNFRAAREISELLGIGDPHSLLRLDASQLALSERMGGLQILRRPDYLRDAMFQGRASQNPFYAGAGMGRAS